MERQLIDLIRRIRESLFAIPLLVIAVCAVLAFVALYLDDRFGEMLEDWPVILGTTVSGARAIAASVAAATITVAAIVLSITALSTQMAANQYSPRALGEFFEDPFQQAIIGLVVGTFTYSLLVLGSLGSGIVDGSAATPSASVTLSIVLGVASAVGIVAYINHSLRRMQIDSVVQRIAADSIRAIHRQLDNDEEDDEPGDGPSPRGDARAITSEVGGWVVSIDAEAALEALPPESTARIDVRVGEAVSIGDRIITVWPDPGEEWHEESHIRRTITTEQERSLELDPTFGIRQLVDIALRALSVGVNDPTTAVDVIHHLKTPVRTVLLSDAPRRVFAGPDDRKVFLSRSPGRSDYVHAAFTEIRLAAAGQPYVLRALLEVLGDLKSDLAYADMSERGGPVTEELELTLAMARSSQLPEADLRRVLEQWGSDDYLKEDDSSG